MKREIPQKVEACASQNPLGNAAPASTLLRRTRSSIVIGCTIVLSTAGSVYFQAPSLATAGSLPSALATVQSSLPLAPTVGSAAVNASSAEVSSDSVLPLTVSFQAGPAFEFSGASSAFTTTAPNLIASTLDTETLLSPLDPGAQLPIPELAPMATQLESPQLAGTFTSARPDLSHLTALLSPDRETAPFKIGFSEPQPLFSSLLSDAPVVITASRSPLLGLNKRSPQLNPSERPRLGQAQPPTEKATPKAIIPNPHQAVLAESGAVVHQIEPGETLDEIAAVYAVEPEEIAKVNRLETTKAIDDRKTLRIPTQANRSATDKPEAAEPPARLSSSQHPEWLTALKPSADVLKRALPTEDSRSPMPEALSALGGEPLSADVTELSGDDAGLLGEQPQTLGSTLTASLSPESSPSSLASPLATRITFPRIPTLDLPPLSDVDKYLPDSMLTGSGRFIWPAQGVFTSGFGPRWGRMHRGIDIAAPVGTPVVASAPGVVSFAGWNSGGFGYLVELRHPDGTLTLYAHNNRILVRQGQSVRQGQQIADMGSTGRSTGPHTHFEIHPMGRGAVNPLQFLTRS